MFWLPELWQNLLVSAPLKAAGIDLKSGFGQYFPGGSDFWKDIELIKITSLDGHRESFCTLNQHKDPELINLFGAAPDSSLCILHTAPWEPDGHPVPVLLVHGAALNGNSWVVDFGDDGEGLARFLNKRGFRVFALTFSHPHGDNLIQAAQLAEAVRLICERTGCEKIDLVCHSKGGIACRAWMQGMIGAKYQGNVRRLVLTGVPNLGSDQVFRHPLLSIMSYTLGVSSVVAYDRMWIMGMLIDTTLESVYSEGSFRGQTQLLHEWAPAIPLDYMEPEVENTYYGGSGLFGHSRGIKQAIAEGGNFLRDLNNREFPCRVEVSIAAGSNHSFGQVPGEICAPSDGMVFVRSAVYDEPFTRSGCRLRAVDVIEVNHLEMIYHAKMADWVIHQLTDK